MSGLIVFIGIITIVRWFILRNRAQKLNQHINGWQKYLWVIGLILLISGSLTAPKKADNLTKATSYSSSTSPASSSSHTKETIKAVKIGMSKSEVEKILGKPDSDDGDVVTYNKYGALYFSKDKLTGGEDNSIQSQASSKLSSQKAAQSEKRSDLISQAKYFGTKDVESIQKATYAYASTSIDGGMMYMWKSSAGTLVRVDLDESGKTVVYKYDDSKDNGLGEQLYVGKTILQKKPRTTVIYP